MYRQAEFAPPCCTIRVQRKRDWTAIVLRGELDLFSSQELVRRVRAESARRKPVMVELAGLEFSDLSGIRALTQLVREGQASGAGGEVELHGARGQVRELMDRLGTNLAEYSSRAPL